MSSKEKCRRVFFSLFGGRREEKAAVLGLAILASHRWEYRKSTPPISEVLHKHSLLKAVTSPCYLPCYC